MLRPPRSRIRRWGIRPLLALLLLLAMLPATILALMQTLHAHEDARALRESDLLDRAVRGSFEARDALLEMRAGFSALARLHAGNFGDTCLHELQRLLETDRRFVSAQFVAPDGTLACAAGEPGLAFAPDAAGPAEPRFRLIDPAPAAEATGGGVPNAGHRLVLSAPAFGPSGFEGTLTAAVSGTLLKELVQQSSDDAIWTRTALIAADGRVIVAAGSEGAAREWLRWSEIERIRATGFGAVLERGAGDEGVALRVPLVDGEIWLAVGLSDQAAYRTLDFTRSILLVLPFALVLIGVLAAYLAADRLIVRHVLYLARIARAYGTGRLGLRPRIVEQAAPQELVELGRSFSDMAGRLQDRTESLQRSLDDNRRLLFEVYHRVKNNLQMMVSLTNLQIRDSLDEATAQVLRQMQARIYGLSVVHQGLQLSGFSEVVRVDQMIEKLLEHLGIDPGDTGDRVTVSLDEVLVPAERAVPVGMLAAEALNDPAFDLRGAGSADRLDVRLAADGDGPFTLRIRRRRGADTARLLPGRLSARLIRGFARQLRADFDLREDGDSLTLVLAVPPAESAGERAGEIAGRRAIEALEAADEAARRRPGSAG